MFNIGFSELVILAIIGLLVIGPEQLPELARKIAKILNELKRAKEEIMAPLDDLKHEAQASLMKLRQGIDDETSQLNKNFENLGQPRNTSTTNKPAVTVDKAGASADSSTDEQKKTDT